MMRANRSIRLALAAMLGGTLLLFAAPAQAQDYPGGATLTVSDTSPECDDTITISGTDFEPNATVSISWNGEAIGTATTDGSGAFSFPYTIPCPFVGTAHIEASDGVNVLGISLTVRAAGEARDDRTVTAAGTLPRTGSDNGNLIRAGVALLVVGGLLVLATRRRAGKMVDA
jgi:LPXTG-motif cell wall-anchored protein